MRDLVERLELESQKQAERLDDELREMAYQAVRGPDELDWSQLSALLRESNTTPEGFERLVEIARHREEIRTRLHGLPAIQKELKATSRELSDLESEFLKQKQAYESQAFPKRDRVRQLERELANIDSDKNRLSQPPTEALRMALRSLELKIHRLQGHLRSCADWQRSKLQEELAQLQADREGLAERIQAW